MAAQQLILLAVAFHRLALAALNAHHNIFIFAAAAVATLQHHHVGIMVYHRGIAVPADAAFAEAQVVDSIENIRLAHTVIAGEAIDFWRKLQVCLCNVLIIQY